MGGPADVVNILMRQESVVSALRWSRDIGTESVSLSDLNGLKRIVSLVRIQ